ncbi:hypothetical protein C0966_17485 (plasmid) [Bacillus methanolicus]|uniref:hypothetical protein n=1 Tax=Bacillus methanolicus TaxID=1471 RepID=UPI002380B72B|nr:hypothetical protein [Bacillus methanolicus]MDE3841057.1 hypothetical protein [Bacillus methanolicus]
MEAKLNDSILKKNYQFESEAQCLFIQKWRELLFYKTINSYQYKLRNIHSILLEIKDVINNIKLEIISISNLKDLILETKKLLERDVVIKKHYKDLLGSLSSGLKPNISEKNELLKLEYRVNYALEIISYSYLDNIIRDLYQSIMDNNINVIEPLTEILATQLINTGWSSRSLHRLGKIIFLTNDGNNFESKWDNFSKLIKSDKGLYHCYFEVRIDNDELIKKIESAGIRIITGLEILQSFNKIGPNHIKETGFYIEEKAEAFHEDMYTAVNDCKHNLSLKQSVLSFYGINVSFQNAVLIIFPNEDKLVPFSLVNGNTLYYEPSEEDILTTSRTIKNELINKDDRKRLQNFYRQYAVSVNASSNEITFSSLWSALESILVTGHHESNIEHIKKIVPSVMCSMFVQRLLKNFLYDCNRVGVLPTFNNKPLNTERPEEKDIRNLFNILKDENEYQQLINKIDNYVLLRQRCIELKNDLENSESLYKLMTGHYNTISMHIQRLYRVRNNLVHAAHVEKDIDLLVEHLHFYIRSTISELVQRLTQHNFKSLGDLFMAIEDNYYALIEILKENIKSSPRKNIKDYDPEIIFSGPIFNYS